MPSAELKFFHACTQKKRMDGVILLFAPMQTCLMKDFGNLHMCSEDHF